MRISDWGSDVCSSDLEDAAGEEIPAAVDRGDAAITTSDLTIDDAGEQDGEEEAEMRGPTPVAAAQRVEGEAWGEAGESGRNHIFSMLCPKARPRTRKSWHFVTRVVSRAGNGINAHITRLTHL